MSLKNFGKYFKRIFLACSANKYYFLATEGNELSNLNYTTRAYLGTKLVVLKARTYFVEVYLCI